MTTARITSKGQITIPKEVRDRLGLRTGDEVEFAPGDQGFTVKKKVGPSPFAPFRGVSKDRLRKLGFTTSDEFIEGIRGR